MNLDSLADIQKIDTKNTLGSISSLADQMQQSWDEMKALTLPPEYAQATHIVVAGMGGSALGGRMLHSLFADGLRAPLEVVTGYHLPNYVGPNTLTIISSYSGTTEETVRNLDEAHSKGAKVFVLASGGQLAEKAKEYQIPSYIFDPKSNPSGQPRLALGYSATAILALLNKLSFLTVSDEDVVSTIESVRGFTKNFSVESGENTNEAKKLAREFKNRIPILVASEHLVGVTHAVKNQFNETSKNFSALFDLPELNHHLLEGLKNPAPARDYIKFLLFQSDLYTDRVQKRYVVTTDVIAKNEAEYMTYKLSGQSKMKQVFELLTLGSFTTFYLAMLYNVDPSQIPWVDYFKEQMGH